MYIDSIDRFQSPSWIPTQILELDTVPNLQSDTSPNPGVGDRLLSQDGHWSKLKKRP